MKELKQVLTLIKKVSSNPRVKPDSGDQLLKARRELLGAARSGRLDRQRLFKAVESIASVLQDIVDEDDNA